MTRALMANMLNIEYGTSLAPWDIDELQQEWIDLAMLKATEMPKIQKGQRQVDKHFQKFRRSHPTYRRH